ncbi:hypothetical protein NLM33_13665 [Bradyrhizobium sp. CCGUVB1N3]|uniref:hypothetical protein n=1 Tax=Bradyrhizobium sp. CCGUVB1N3 TaxID=2949629 RepID=UPI0020B22B36|nr:hypothetical protein [Bradyrhizobium sp. CCGUVB1N3]MCP3471379.1 hypothetical protein [Bradyrhizobium sp. CCGUVB1N3]
MFYVYKFARMPRPGQWAFASQHSKLEDAEAAARKLCPQGFDVCTEPSTELRRGFFGSVQGLNWSAMIARERLG